MRLFRKLFRQTFIYGMATVLPRMLSFLLVPLYTDVMPAQGYGELTIIFTFFAIFNVILAYGMETAFFRFYNSETDPKLVLSTSLITLLTSTAVFLMLGFLFWESIGGVLNIDSAYVGFFLGILALDALVIVPFAQLRAMEQSLKYALIKIVNVAVNILLNVLFLVCIPNAVSIEPEGFLAQFWLVEDQIYYILLAMMVSSGITLLMLVKVYFKTKWVFNTAVSKRMLKYGFPVMIAGIAFTVNEVFDKYLLSELLPVSGDLAIAEVGKYAACYKLAMFMTLFATAFRLGIEPFFFAHAKSSNPQQAYAGITQYFIILGSLILLFVVVFSDVIKRVFIQDPVFWEAMEIVPIVLTASLFLGIYHNLSVWYKITDRTRFGAIISIIGALLTIGINVAFIPKYGYYASAWATLAAYGTMMVLSYSMGKRYYPIPYNMRKIGFYLIGSMLFSIISFYGFRGNLFVGGLLIFVFAGITYRMEKEQVLKIIRNR